MIQSPVLVGRDTYLTLVEARLAGAAAGAGQLLFVAGEAGIGKTRLLGSAAGLRAQALTTPTDMIDRGIRRCVMIVLEVLGGAALVGLAAAALRPTGAAARLAGRVAEDAGLSNRTDVTATGLEPFVHHDEDD
jgi:hypothetical protein